ncbi:MAG: hypothetical protein K0B01_03455 [Syntrophobacterales bacterium]|nr:hypothetical protein [Syntrophobacterales bacterium]
MTGEKDLQEIRKKINSLRETAEEIKAMGEDFPALYRNSSRILASIKMLEINIPDVSAL